ncbi:MAG TPA: minor capsid protein, partial [Ruminococcaceae bacterium]|nr:minor capsid protein [Oscillospiraceae bacterium]
MRMMNDTYRSTIFKYSMYVTNGVYTEKQAYDAAVKDFLSRGINCIEYKDGRRVNIADYTSMAIRTVNQRAYMAGEGEFRKYLGETLVIISHHATSCKLCKPFENKVLIDDVYSGGTPDDGDYMLLSQAMAEGLFHPRCRHGLGTYYPELEDIVHYETEDNRLNEYGTEELNRAHIENMIQKYKRLTIGSLDPANIAKYRARLNEWERRKAQLGIANSENSGIINYTEVYRKKSEH